MIFHRKCVSIESVFLQTAKTMKKVCCNIQHRLKTTQKQEKTCNSIFSDKKFCFPHTRKCSNFSDRKKSTRSNLDRGIFALLNGFQQTTVKFLRIMYQNPLTIL